jgi:hypothetical protein
MVTSRMSPISGILISAVVSHWACQKVCWRKICTLRQAHSKPNKLASHANRFQDVPVNFHWKLTKDKVVKFQSLELAGWYQTVPYLWLGKPCEMTYSYKKLSASKLETIRELQSIKQNIAKGMT